MLLRFKTPLLLALIVVTISQTGALRAEDQSTAEAWSALPKYEYGQDMRVLLSIDRAVIQAMTTPKSQAACAAKLGAILESEDVTLDACQYICLQLRQIGTSSQVPVLAKMLAHPETCEMARMALEAIPGDAAGTALREALSAMKGRPLVGIINSLGARGDAMAVGPLKKSADSDDKQVVEASLRALATIGDEGSMEFLLDRFSHVDDPIPAALAKPVLRCAAKAEGKGEQELVEPIYQRLARKGQPRGVRRASLEALLRLQGDQATATVLSWFADASDTDRRQVASGHLRSLPDAELDQLLDRLEQLPDAGKLAVIELAASRRGQAVLPMILTMARSDNLDLQVAGIRYLGIVGDESAIDLLIDFLGNGDESVAAAQQALAGLPREAVTTALLKALKERPDIRPPVIDVLIELKCYDAIDPLIEIAANSAPEVYDPALYGLRGIADPDKTDTPRLVKLLLRSQAGRQQDEVEKTILIVAQKLPEDKDRAELVLASLAGVDASLAPKYLPVLGRLGGQAALQKIQDSIESDNTEIRTAAIRALCNWPNAEVADRLLGIAEADASRTFRHWALRAYIRVITLESERPENETLTMLKKAMKLAEATEDRQLAVERAATVRTIEAVDWIAEFLEDPALAQSACESLVELAHHRFLRHPNMDRFGPILEHVARISQDEEVVERAKRYRLGL